MICPPLYKRDTKGRQRIWQMEQEGAKHRSIAGLIDGQSVTCDWTVCEGKNVGRANETTPEEQAAAEIEAHYTKRLDRGYFRELETIDSGTIFNPMLAKKYEKDDGNFFNGIFSQPKLDGIRCIASKDGLKSRSGKPLLSTPHIFQALKDFFNTYPDVILDGELYNHELKEDFNKILSLVRKTKPTPDDIKESAGIVEYHVYDCFHPNTPDLVFEERNKFIRAAVANLAGSIRIVETKKTATSDEIDEHYAHLLEVGYEGQIVRLNEPYENKRSYSLLKRKEFIDEEFVVTEILEGRGNWAGYGKRIVCRLSDGRTFGAGVKGNQEYALDLLRNAKSYVGGTATVRYQNLTPDGIPRFPIAVAIYQGKRDL